MSAKRVRCPCGKILALPESAAIVKVRCPSCGVVLRLKPHGAAASPERWTIARREMRSPPPLPPEPLPDPSLGEEPPEYRIVVEPQASAVASRGEVSGGTFIPIAGALRPAGLGPRVPPGGFVATAAREPVDRAAGPGPILDLTMLFYPWLYPTWVRWIGLAFIIAFTSCIVAITLFVLSIAAAFGAVGSIFTVAGMATACLAFVAYITACFVAVIEGTANGDDRFQQLPGFQWYETLPSLFRTWGAAAASVAVAYGITYPLRPWLPPDDPQFYLLSAFIVYLFFPVLLITNLVDDSWFPFYSLFPTLVRLVRCGPHFVLFLVMSGVLALTLGIVLGGLFVWRIAAGLAAAGPVLATWLLYYGYWIGRLARQMAAAE